MNNKKLKLIKDNVLIHHSEIEKFIADNPDKYIIMNPEKSPTLGRCCVSGDIRECVNISIYSD